MNKLLDVIYQPYSKDWPQLCQAAFEELFGSSGGRYPDRAQKVVTVRAPQFRSGDGVPFAALIDPSNPDSGAYGGMSFVIFPVEEGKAMLAMVVGTQGLSPDEDVLGRPGHGRKVSAICKWLNNKYGQGQMVAWAKQDPARIDLDTPDNIKRYYSVYKSVFERYGKVIYGLYSPNEDKDATKTALAAFLDLMFAERGIQSLKAAETEATAIETGYYAHMFPDVRADEVVEQLESESM